MVNKFNIWYSGVYLSLLSLIVMLHTNLNFPLYHNDGQVYKKNINLMQLKAKRSQLAITSIEKENGMACTKIN